MVPNDARSLLERAERDDPRGHALHVAAAMAWCFLEAIANTPEAIAWGVLLVVWLLRLPRIWRCVLPSLRDPIWLAFLAWWLWSLLTLSWAPPEVDLARQLRPERAILTPLLLLPVASRSWALLGALAAGSAVQLVAVLVHAMLPLASGGSIRTYGEMEGLTAFRSMGWYLQIAAVVPLAAIAAMKDRARWCLVPLPILATIAIFLSGLRSVLGNLLAGGVVLALRPRRPRRAAQALVGAALLAGAITLAAVLSPGSLDRLTRGPARALSLLLGPDGPLGASAAVTSPADSSREQVLSLGSDRVGLWWASIDMIRGDLRTALVGSGRGSFPQRWKEWLDAEREAHPALEAFAARAAANRHPHNLQLRAWIEGGLPQLALATITIWALAARLWRRSANDAALAAMLAVYAAVVVSSLIGIAEAKAPGAIIGLAIALSRGAREQDGA